ncbi:unnamed protein product [Prorocentrum cordatum]|uniref:C3H1-type domain-containing protein n=1 Tax=Prorocentrum cordatum TaxID=2364126 RepID=A0ABN9XFX4_9DINO|nr:unnamed protein product [Polarella glacialis]
MRMWGRWGRLRRVNQKFEAVAAAKVQSDAAARARPAAADLKPDVGGVFAWRMAAISEALAGGLVVLEEACSLIENLLFLCGWVKDIDCLVTFHERFWSRVRRSRQPMPGYRPITLTEVQRALCLFQGQWAKASRNADELDGAHAQRASEGDLCWHFSSGKTCKHGDACWFRHACLAPASAAADFQAADAQSGYLLSLDWAPTRASGALNTASLRRLYSRPPATPLACAALAAGPQPAAQRAQPKRQWRWRARHDRARHTWPSRCARRCPPPYAPPPCAAWRPGLPRPGAIPWCGGAAAAPPRPLGAPRRCGKAATQLQRTIALVQHIDRAWGHANGQPLAAWAEPPTAPLPAPIRSALFWARDCPDYEPWVIGQIQYWKRVQDTDVIADIMSAFRMRGVLPDTKLFENVGGGDLPDAAPLGRALEHALDSKGAMLLEMLQNAKREPVWLDAAGRVNFTVPFARWLPTRHFPRVQGRAAASYKVRPIDDATASGLILAVATQGRMRMAGLASLLDAVFSIAETFRDWGDGGVPLIAKGDHAQACRQWPVHPDDAPLLVCLVWDDSVGHAGGYRACAHKALPFGAFGAVWGWAALHEWVFQELHAMLGIPLKEGMNQGPAAVLDLLGLGVLTIPRWAGLRLTAKRRAALSDDVGAALRARRLCKRDAARLGGQLGFATSAMFGRVGRAYASPVPARAGGAIGGMVLSPISGGHSLSAHIPPNLCAELLKVGKKQRNTQSELLAVRVLLLTCPEVVRGARLILFEDNTPALENIRRGAAGDDDSVAIAGAIFGGQRRGTCWVWYGLSPSRHADPAWGLLVFFLGGPRRTQVRMCKGDGPEGALWQVVGGGASGGLIVRDGQGTSAPEADCRLSTGALVRQLALDGGRLRYELVTGDGPRSGWVSTSYRGKDLVARLEDVTEQQQQRLALQQYAGRFGRPAAGDGGPDRPGSQRRAFSWRADAQHEAPARPEERARGELERALGLAAACAGGAGASAEDSDGEEVQLCGHCRLPLGERVYTSSGSKVPLHEECVSEFMVRSLSEQEASRLREEQKLKSATRAEYGIGWKHEALGNHSTPQGMCCMVLDPASGSVRIAPTMEPAAAVNLEYLSTALKVRRDEGREPYFSLDPTGTEWARGAMQEKRFEPEWLAGTSVGEVMFQADYHLKELSMGEHEQPVVGMKSCWQLEDSDRANEDEWNAREWFVVREADVQMTEDGALVPFVKMGVEAREQIETASGLEDAPITKPEHPLVRYAQAFSKNFDLIAERRSVVYHLRELAKASVLAKFLLEAEVPLEESWFGLSRVVEPACSLEVPQLWNERYHAAIAVQGGGVEEQVVAPQVRGVYGGVQFGLERFSVGARAASTSVQLGRVGARGPMPRVSAPLAHGHQRHRRPPGAGDARRRLHARRRGAARRAVRAGEVHRGRPGGRGLGAVCPRGRPRPDAARLGRAVDGNQRHRRAAHARDARCRPEPRRLRPLDRHRCQGGRLRGPAVRAACRALLGRPGGRRRVPGGRRGIAEAGFPPGSVGQARGGRSFRAPGRLAGLRGGPAPAGERRGHRAGPAPAGLPERRLPCGEPGARVPALVAGDVPPRPGQGLWRQPAAGPSAPAA